MKLFLSILHTVLKYVLDYLSAATITLKSDILQLIQSSWSFLTFQIIGIKHYKLYCRCFCSYSQQSCHFSLYLLTCYNTYFCTASLNGSLVIWTVSGLFPCLWIMRTFSAVKKMFVFCISSATVPTWTIEEIHLTYTKPMSPGFQRNSWWRQGDEIQISQSIGRPQQNYNKGSWHLLFHSWGQKKRLGPLCATGLVFRIPSLSCLPAAPAMPICSGLKWSSRL